jgi:hypothetical protein
VIVPALLLAAKVLDKALAVAQIADKVYGAVRKAIRPKPIPAEQPWSYRDVANRERQIRSAARKFPPKD